MSVVVNVAVLVAVTVLNAYLDDLPPMYRGGVAIGLFIVFVGALQVALLRRFARYGPKALRPPDEDGSIHDKR